MEKDFAGNYWKIKLQKKKTDAKSEFVTHGLRSGKISFVYSYLSVLQKMIRTSYADRNIYRKKSFANLFRIGIILFYLIFLLGIYSCSTGHKIAKDYISSGDTINILLLKKDSIIKKNLKIKTDSLSETVADSFSLNQSQLLKKIDNKVFNNLLIAGIADKLKKYRVHVYFEEDMNAFMQLKTKGYIFNLAQLEIDESFLPYTASQQYDTLTYQEDFELNMISANLWFEVSELNGDQKKNRVLYSTDNISDRIDGYFRKAFLSNEVKYIYTRQDISVDDVYTMATEFGSLNADYIFDYFLNEFFFAKYPGNKKLKYFHYDLRNGKIYPAGYNRFIFM